MISISLIIIFYSLNAEMDPGHLKEANEPILVVESFSISFK